MSQGEGSQEEEGQEEEGEQDEQQAAAVEEKPKKTRYV